MLAPSIVLVIAGAYLGGLFLIAYLVDRMSARGGARFMSSPLVYTLSLAVYCTSWTFYGAVGTAARSGLEFVTIYLGPTLVFMAWWIVVRKLVRIGRAERITSIADFVSARYGKSAVVSALLTIIAIVATTPYIALQLKAVATSFEALAAAGGSSWPALGGIAGTAPADAGGLLSDTGLWTAVLMAVFVILFGTRHIAADESNPGVVAAIAFESIVKLVAVVAVGVFVVFTLNGGVAATFERVNWSAEAARIVTFEEGFASRWVAVTFLSAAAILCLPRQFQVMVVENRDERHLKMAAWLFPLYLLAISLFVVPIAITGVTTQPETANADLFVLTVPLSTGHDLLALFAFIGGLSAATSMVIVASIALSIMISNHLLAPMLFRLPDRFAAAGHEGLRPALLTLRRVAIILILVLGYGYYRLAAPAGGLASIGLISFAGVAQFLPALIGGIFWRGATRAGAVAGLSAGFAVWLVTLFLPSFAGLPGSAALLSDIRALILPAEAGEGVDPLEFALLLSLGANLIAYVVVSITTRQRPLERLQAALFVDVFDRPDATAAPALPRSADPAELHRLVVRILGNERADHLFGGSLDDPRVRAALAADHQFIARIERELGNAIGAASARLVVSRIAKGEGVGLEAAMTLLDETRAAIRTSRALARKSEELARTAEQLRTANEQLQQMDRLKDEFLSQVSHELRTPMTAIRSFSELLAEEADLDGERARRFIRVIEAESERMTRLLDEILDLSRIESGQIGLAVERLDLGERVGDAIAAMDGLAEQWGVSLRYRQPDVPIDIAADADRLKQVLVNLLSNAIKFAGPEVPTVEIACGTRGGEAFVEVIDNGPGIGPDVRDRLFTKFSRGWRQPGLSAAGDGARRQLQGSGLGLAISRQIANAMGGRLELGQTGPDGSVFRLVLPLHTPIARVGRAAAE